MKTKPPTTIPVPVLRSIRRHVLDLEDLRLRILEQKALADRQQHPEVSAMMEIVDEVVGEAVRMLAASNLERVVADKTGGVFGRK